MKNQEETRFNSESEYLEYLEQKQIKKELRDQKLIEELSQLTGISVENVEEELYNFLFEGLELWLNYRKSTKYSKIFLVETESDLFSLDFEDLGSNEILVHFHVETVPAFTAVLDLVFSEEGLFENCLFAQRGIGNFIAFQAFEKVMFSFNFKKHFED